MPNSIEIPPTLKNPIVLKSNIWFDAQLCPPIIDILVLHGKRSEHVLCCVEQKDGRRMIKEGYAFIYSENTNHIIWKIPGTIYKVTQWTYMPELPNK